jgi:double-stranded uracil-DNA glycosylase
VTSYQPDILANNLKVVFCGLNPALSAVHAGHNFSSPTNRFWRVLHRAGFTDVRLEPREERRLLDYGYGVSALVEQPSRRAREVTRAEFQQARLSFEAKMRCYTPRIIAFLGKQGLGSLLGTREIAWGPNPTTLSGCATWVLPNPSGLNRSFSLEALVEAYRELRIAVAR